jgi:hypothetical protein
MEFLIEKTMLALCLLTVIMQSSPTAEVHNTLNVFTV